jgi:hypothetical protein
MTIKLINYTKEVHPVPSKEFSLLEINGKSFFSMKRTINYHKSHVGKLDVKGEILFTGPRIVHEVDLIFVRFMYESDIE